MRIYLLLICVIFASACSRYDVDKPEYESIPTMNALFIPGEPLRLQLSNTGTLQDIEDSLEVAQSVLYAEGLPVDTFLYESGDSIERNRTYRLVVELDDGSTLSANCQTHEPFTVRKIAETELDPPIQDGLTTYNWEYKVLLRAPSSEAGGIPMLFRPVTTDTLYNSVDSSVRRIRYNTWNVGNLPAIMKGREHFMLPQGFSDTLTFHATVRGVVRFARISPVLFEALEQHGQYENLETQTVPVSASNVEGGTGIVSFFDTQVARY